MRRGFSLIEALAVLFIFSVVTLSFYESWTLGTRHILNAKNRLGATAMANQRMEIVRNLDYDFIGTTTGIPSGSLIETETVAASSTSYTIHTSVVYEDDPQDGTIGSGDLVPNDYKLVRIAVSWGGGGDSQQVVHVSTFSQDGVESAAANTGVLAVNVLDSGGVGVAGATLHITNSSVAPAVDITTTTDATGHYDIPGAPASTTGYRIEVSKTGYYSNRTYPPYPTSAYNPTHVDPIIVAGSLTQSTVVIDRKSSFTIQSEDPFGNNIADIDFSITGGQLSGIDPTSSLPVYEFTQTTGTDDEGEKEFTNRSYGPYTVTLDPLETDYTFLMMNPRDTAAENFSIAANTSTNVKMVLLDKNYGSVLVKVTKESDGSVISGATVRLTSAVHGYDVTLTTDALGYAFFPVVDSGLLPGSYDLEVTATGFADEDQVTTVPGPNLQEVTIEMAP